jgi:hypothetical protein
MNRRDWNQLQFYGIKCLASVAIVLAIAAIVSGGVNTFQLFNNNNPQSTNK